MFEASENFFINPRYSHLSKMKNLDIFTKGLRDQETHMLTKSVVEEITIKVPFIGSFGRGARNGSRISWFIFVIVVRLLLIIVIDSLLVLLVLTACYCRRHIDVIIVVGRFTDEWKKNIVNALLLCWFIKSLLYITVTILYITSHSVFCSPLTHRFSCSYWKR